MLVTTFLQSAMFRISAVFDRLPKAVSCCHPTATKTYQKNTRRTWKRKDAHAIREQVNIFKHSAGGLYKGRRAIAGRSAFASRRLGQRFGEFEQFFHRRDRPASRWANTGEPLRGRRAPPAARRRRRENPRPSRSGTSNTRKYSGVMATNFGRPAVIATVGQLRRSVCRIVRH